MATGCSPEFWNAHLEDDAAAHLVVVIAAQRLAVRGIVFSAAGTAGQRCTTLRRIIVPELSGPELLATIKRDF